MSIKNKVIGIFSLFSVILVLVVVIILLMEKNSLHQQAKQTNEELEEQAHIQVTKDLEQLTALISNQVVTMEKEIDHSMLNAALVLKEMDWNGSVTLQDLEELKASTGMSDFYITNLNGVFTTTTETEAVGVSLFDIWDGYRMLLTGESDQLLSAMKIKEETGEIFKFTAIPRAGEQGKGFAVVADEVRKLAEQSAGATDKISNILMDLQNEIQLAKESNDQQIDIIESSKSDMTEAKSSIEGLIESTEKSSTQIKQLSELVVILQQASHEENQVFSELYTRIQSNAANSQELLSMIDEVSTSVKHLNRLLESLANSTRKLENVF